MQASDLAIGDGGWDYAKSGVAPSPPASQQLSRADLALIREAEAQETAAPGGGEARARGAVSGLVSSNTTKCTKTRAYRGEKRIARLRKAVPSAAAQIGLAAARGFRQSVAMVTLTYRPGVDWQPNHIRDFQSAIKEYLARQSIKYRSVWVLESTKKGQPHYHVLIWLPRACLKGRKLPKPDDRGWWPHGSTRIEWARNAIGYLVKYTSKAGPDDRFPAGARLFGVRGLEGTFRRAHRLHMLPFWLRDIVGRDCLCRRGRGGWWISEAGELLRSPYVIVARCPRWSWVEFGLREAAGVPEEAWSARGQAEPAGGHVMPPEDTQDGDRSSNALRSAQPADAVVSAPGKAG